MKTIGECPKCGGRFEEGVVRDSSYAVVLRSEWARRPGWLIFGIGARDVRKITSYRCENCGYLENYAY